MYGVITVLALVVVTVALSRLQAAVPAVDESTLWMGTVKRGPMIRQVRGAGILVPEEIRWIPAVTQGRVERRLVLPGTSVKPSTIPLELSNPDVQQAFVVAGRVSRIDPSVQSGTRTVDVTLEGPLPPGAVPDLSVDGTIEIERLTDVLFVERPVQGQAHSTVGLFKRVEDASEAVRGQVKLGRSSVSTIEVLDGLKVGDRVILSDMSAQDAVNRIRLQSKTITLRCRLAAAG